MIGAGSGFVAGLLGYGANMRMAALRRMNFTPQQMIATASATALFVNLGRLPAYLSRLQWTDELRILLLSSIPTILVSVFLGRFLHEKFPVHHLEYAIDVVIVLGGITMIARSL